MAFQAKALKKYNQSSKWQLQHSLNLIPIISKYLNLANSLNPERIHIVDYACSEGYTSMMTFQKVFSEFRSHSQTPIHITHTDLPENDWCEFFKTINNSENSHINQANVHYSAIGKSYYNQLLPSGSVNLGFATNSLHYLSKIPPRQSNPSMFYPEAADQFKSDFKQNLTYRISELSSKGYLIFSNLTKPLGGFNPMDKILSKSLENCLSKGVFSESEYKKFYWPFYPQDESHLKEVLKCFEGQIEVKLFEFQTTPNPYYADYLKNGRIEDLKINFGNMFGVFVLNMVNTAVEGNAERKEKVYNQVMDGVRENIKAEDSFLHYNTVVIQKI